MSYVSPFTGDVILPTDVSFRSITLTTDVTLSWPINGNATDNYAARIMEVTAPTSNKTLTMPPANQTSVGTDALIQNVGGETFTVLDNSGGTIVTILAGEAKYIYVTANPNVGGTWGIFAFGVGTSNPDASVLAGYGLLAQGATLNQSHPTGGVADGYTVASTDRAQTLIWSSGAGILNLPPAASLGDNWFFLFKNTGTGYLTMTASSGETIDGSLTKAFAPLESAIVICTGSEYITIGYGQSTQFIFTTLVKPVVSGTYILTVSEATNIIQEYVGTLTGDVTIVLPPASLLFVVSNQTVAGLYSLSFTTTYGNTVAVAVNQQATLICDGTNLFNANTVITGGTAVSLVNGSMANPSLSFVADATTGIYRPSAGLMGISVLGNELVEYSATGEHVIGDISATGTGNFEGGVSGGIFT
jgi:hypothetical protein